jgi:hypothetical protein
MTYNKKNFPLFLICSTLVKAMILKLRRNEASILTSFFSISKRNEPAYSSTCKDRSKVFIPQIRKIVAEQTMFIPKTGKIEAKRSLFIPQIRKNEEERTLFIPQIGQIKAKRSLFIPQIRKNEAKRSLLFHIFKTFMEPRN